MSEGPTPPATASKNLREEVARLDYQANIQEAADRLRFQQEIGLAACKSTILVNGGAIIALLTFIGNHPAGHDIAGLKQAFGGFSVGIVSTLVSLWLAYLGQDWLSNMRVSVAWNSQQDMKGEP